MHILRRRPPLPPLPPQLPAYAPPCSRCLTSFAGAKCKVTNGGACISDRNYGGNVRCTFLAEAIISVSATYFDLGPDSIAIGGISYGFWRRPTNVLMAAGQTIEWKTDTSSHGAAL